MQALSGETVEMAGESGDGAGHAGTQGFLHRPERLPVVGGLHDDDADGIEAETVQAMAMQAAAGRTLLL